MVITNSLSAIQSLSVSEADPGMRAENLAKLSMGLAQIGRIDEARTALALLRDLLALHFNPKPAIRAMIAEGVIKYYEDFGDGSDRIRRAFALAGSGGFNDLKAEAAVWLAHSAFNFERNSELREYFSVAIGGFLDLDISHRGRICLLIADSLQLTGEWVDATAWYKLARDLARQAHDHGLIVAIEFNRLAMSLSRIRYVRAVDSSESFAGAKNWLLELQSLRGLHTGLEAKALWELLDLCDAYVFEIEGDFLRAIASLGRIRDSDAAHRCGLSDYLLKLEIAWCQAKLDGLPVTPEWFSVQMKAIEAISENDQLIALHLIGDMVGSNSGCRSVVDQSAVKAKALDHFRRTFAELTFAVSKVKSEIELVSELVAANRQ